MNKSISPNTLVKALNERVSEKYDSFVKSYLFGSYANGQATDESDIDILMIFDKIERQDRFEIAGIVTKIEYENDCFIDYKILKTSEIATSNPFFIKEAIGKGVCFERE